MGCQERAMARQIDKLSALAVKNARKGFHPDGRGLYLKVTEAGSKAWIFRYTFQGRLRDMGLGSLLNVSLAEARKKAVLCRKSLEEHLDPIDARQDQKKRLVAEQAKSLSFDQCRDQFLRMREVEWKNKKHRDQWPSSLGAYCTPVFGLKPIREIDVDDVLKCLEPIWISKPETASRVRGRIETILDWARARGLRAGENPARLKGHLDQLLPRRSRTQTVVHHASLSFEGVAVFLRDLRGQQGEGARALEFAILCASRTGEVIGAEWKEFDLAGKIWTLPPGRMKAGRQHTVPLSRQAMLVLENAKLKTGSQRYVFGSGDRPLSIMALNMTLRRMRLPIHITVHGFRATFKTWASEKTNYQREVVEAALAHASGDKLEAAYQRGEFLQKRTRLMCDWGAFCELIADEKANVVPFRSLPVESVR
jgi:integrase